MLTPSSRTPIVAMLILALFTILAARWSPESSGDRNSQRTPAESRGGAAVERGVDESAGTERENAWKGDAERGPAEQGPPPPGFVDIPVRIVGRADGSWALETRRLPKDDPEAKEPSTVPIFSLNAKGQLKSGVWYINRTNEPQFMAIRQPGAVFRDIDGVYKIKYILRAQADGETITPGGEMMLPGPDFVEVVKEWRRPSIPQTGAAIPDRSRNNNRNCNLVIVNFLDEPLATIAGSAIERVSDRICQMLSLEQEQIFVILQTSASLPSGMSALPAFDFEEPYSNSRLLLEFFPDSFSDASEHAIYENLPNSLSAQVRNFGLTTITKSVIPIDLYQKWGGSAAEDTHFINVSSTSDWHCDWQVPTPPTAVDFEAAMTHEMLHVLGYFSMIDSDPAVFANYSQIFDFLRLRGTQGSVSGQTFFNAVRWFLPEISPGHRCVTKLSNAAWVFPMSTGIAAIGGDGYQAMHWKSDQVWGSRIGIMDPLIRLGEIYPTYLYASDIRAIDLIGWDIDESQVEQAPQPPEPIDPPNNEVEVLLATTFTWTPTTSNSSLFVFEGTTPSVDTLVFEARNLSGSSFTLPTGTLQGGTTYSWYVVAVGNVERTFGPTRTFTTRCVADFDGSGFVDTEDIDAFVQAYELGDISADVDGTGFVDTEDFDFFVRAYEGGC
jgi:hypothetical protein